MGKKLIEVALPLDAINAAAAREKSIRHGHPSTLHLWWARRPLAAARAVIFSQMVDDPSAYLDDDHEIEKERNRLFALIEELVLWENTTNEKLLERARAEIRRSWARNCLGNEAVAKLTDGKIKQMLDAGEMEPLPGFHDPFAGGGALPLEAQRLGLESYASDLNPVAVLINKAMIEIPPKFAGMPPVNPEADNGELKIKTWRGAQGLAEDVRYYGQWMRDEAFKRIGHLYPKVAVTEEMSKDRKDLKPYVGKELTVIAWIWARTVKSPNPACSHVDVPLISTYVLSSKKGKEAWMEPVVEGENYRFRLRSGKFPASAKNGTKLGRGANFECILSGTPLEPDYIKAEGKAGRMGAKLLAIVCEGDRGRVYVEALPEHEAVARSAKPEWGPDQELPDDPRNFWTVHYGLTTYASLFTPRQLVALTTFSDLVGEAREKVLRDLEPFQSLEEICPHSPIIGKTEGPDSKDWKTQYADAVATYLAFALSKQADLGNSLCCWEPIAQCPRHLFGRQAIPMTWDYAEGNPLGERSGAWVVFLDGIVKAFLKAFEAVEANAEGIAFQSDAGTQRISLDKVVSSDPPYYDNIGYADLSDFFYVWLRRSLQGFYPALFTTMTVPKAEELVASPYRHGGREQAETFFMDGMTRAIHNMAELGNPAFPVTIYYAFKQSETAEEGVASTGWETFLDAVLQAGFATHGTWPLRTENASRMIGQGTNALASSIVLVCRKRDADAGMTTRRDFQTQLHRELPEALRNLQHGNIAPVDLAQSSIGPGMAIFSRYTKVVEADGSPMKVRTALALINEALDEILAEQEGELDADSRWAVAWFTEYGTGEGPFGRADDLSRAKNTSVEGLREAGIVYAQGGKVNLLRREEMDAEWDPSEDARLTVWEATQHLISRLEKDGEAAAAALLAQLGGVAEQARDLAYRLYNTCERKGWAEEARSYNGLVIAWPELSRLSALEVARRPDQGELTF